MLATLEVGPARFVPGTHVGEARDQRVEHQGVEQQAREAALLGEPLEIDGEELGIVGVDHDIAAAVVAEPGLLPVPTDGLA